MSPAAEDAAWVTIETRASQSQVQGFFADIERAFRANPYLEIKSWREIDTDRFQVELLNLSNGIEQSFELSAVRPSNTEIILRYSTGLKRWTRIELKAAGVGSQVRITDDYGALAPADRCARLAEVDHSLTAWGGALRGYLQRESTLGRFQLWHWLLDRVWLVMKPSARRICIVIAWITLAEFVLAVLVVAIFWLESRP